MSCSLDDIFHQIAESERKAEDRKRLLTEVRLKIDDCTNKRKAVELEHQSCLQQLSIRTDELIDSRLVEKGLALRASIHQEQKDQLSVKKGLLTSQLEKLCAKLDTEREKFSIRVKEFTSGYGFSGKGLQMRELLARQEIQKLIESQQELQSELRKIYEQKKDKQNTVGDKQCSEQKRNQLRDVQKQHKGLVQLSEKMELEKQRISEFPQTDPEFKKLQDEVEASQNTTLESRCRALRLQLQQLQQQHWRHQLKHKKKISQQQQQQRQKAMPPETIYAPKIENDTTLS